MEKFNENGLDFKKENLLKLKTLFPEIFKDGLIDTEILKTLVGEENLTLEEEYSLNWVGKQNALRESLTSTNLTLRPIHEKSVDFDNTKNLYIEGNNLDVLKCLSKTYHNSIKMIYIDPPYNTGSDFIYSDNFNDTNEEYIKKSNQCLKTNPNTSGRFHTNWLNMMYPRIKLGYEMLSKDGVIFISIDDNELCDLKRICDSIFGETNFIAILSVENNPKGRKNSKFVSVSNDYCVVYAKNIAESNFLENIPKNASDLSLDKNGRYVHNSGKRVIIGDNDFNDFVNNLNSEKHYSVYYNGATGDLITKKENAIDEKDISLLLNGYERFISKRDNKFVENTYTENKFLQLVSEDAIEIKSGKIYEKNYSTTIRIKSMLTNKEYKAIVDNEEVDYKIDVKTTSAGTYIKELFGGKLVFSAPKPIGLLEILISLIEGDDFIVLDYFSGSATTADAVMRNNALNKTHKKFIMVQLPEDLDENYKTAKPVEKPIIKSAIDYLDSKNMEHLLTNVGQERIRLCGDIIQENLKNNKKEINLFNQNENIDFNLDTGFKVFKIDTTNIVPWDGTQQYNENSLFTLNKVIKDDRTSEDVAYEIMLKYGVFDKKLENKKINEKNIFSVDNDSMLICLEDKIEEKDINEIVKLSPTVVVFNEECFGGDDNLKQNIEYSLKRLLGEDNIKVLCL